MGMPRGIGRSFEIIFLIDLSLSGLLEPINADYPADKAFACRPTAVRMRRGELKSSQWMVRIRP